MRVAEERTGGEGSGASGGQEAAKPPLSPSSSGGPLPRQSSLPRYSSASRWQTRLQQLQHLVDLVGRDGQRRHEAQRVGPRRVDDQATLERVVDHLRGVAARERDRQQEAAATHRAVTVRGRELAEASDEI